MADAPCHLTVGSDPAPDASREAGRDAITPVRAPLSIRRTSSLDICLPDGPLGPRYHQGRARDLLTDYRGQEVVHDSAELNAHLAIDKSILDVSTNPFLPGLDQIIGCRPGGPVRAAMRRAVSTLDAMSGHPLLLLLDDLSGGAIASNWAWAQWDASWFDIIRQALPDSRHLRPIDRTDACWGLQAGSSGLADDLSIGTLGYRGSGGLINPDDPLSWHDFPATTGASFRRVRRIDVTRDDSGSLLLIDSAFQDSAPTREGDRAVIHEYRLSAKIDHRSGEILQLEAQPVRLPYTECPGAAISVRQLIGGRLTDLRALVAEHLRGNRGCTHLNDAVRALADAAQLTRRLPPVSEI